MSMCFRKQAVVILLEVLQLVYGIEVSIITEVIANSIGGD